MNWDRIITWKWRRYLVAILIIAGASAIRAAFFGGLGRGIAYLTYYPTVMLAALYGGLHAGLLATGISALLCFYWIQKGYMSPVESLAMGVFLISCTMISGIAEAMRRAQARAKQEKEKAEAANLAKSTFLASMSHELRTPLNAILGFSSLMLNDVGVSEEQRKTLNIINRSGEHLLSLINDVLDMAKVDAGRLSLEMTSVDLGEMVLDIIDLLHVKAEEKGLQLLLDQSSEFPRFVQTDALKLRQMLINLIGNAVKFTEQGGVTLRLHAQSADDKGHLLLIVVVEDTGEGITTADQARIFDPFVQVGTLTSQKGTGLGLAITRSYLELMGGRISVASTPGQGSVFRMEIPVEQVEETEVRATGGKRGKISGLVPGQPAYRILIVEDQKENWLLLRRLMEDVGFSVHVAENGKVGVEMFQEWRPHLIWMDIRMPIMDGLEATRLIRALGDGEKVKIVALTASVFKEEQGKVLAAGMDDFVRKPYRPNELFECLTRQLGVQFIYEEAPAAVSREPIAVLHPEALIKLPPELRQELTIALVNLDVVQIEEIIRRVSELDPVLGETLRRYADQFDYTAILRANGDQLKGTT
jgi:signal transduction histidine kinase/DNA-binding NarL/FixJ family response regulator